MRAFIVLLLFFFIELAGFVAFSEEFGFLTLVFEILLSGVLGVFLLISTLSGSNESVIELLRGAKNPKEVLLSNFTKIIGSILLILPGIFGDFLGLFLQFGFLDPLFGSIFSKFGTFAQSQEVIDVEIIEEGERIEDEKTHHRL